MKTPNRNRFSEPPIILHSTTEAAAILGVSTDTLERYLRAGRHPEYVWKLRWREPRWTDGAVNEWGFILRFVSLADLPADRPPIQPPWKAFPQRSRSKRPMEAA